jgi:hypothetical protein
MALTCFGRHFPPNFSRDRFRASVPSPQIPVSSLVVRVRPDLADHQGSLMT